MYVLIRIVSYPSITRAMHDQIGNILVEVQNSLHKAAWRIVVNEVLSE